MRALRLIGVTGVVLFMLAGNAWASKCDWGCRAQRRMCKQIGLVERTACRVDCSDEADALARFACFRGCLDTYHATDLACRAAEDSCEAGCAPGPDVDETCLETCGTGPGSCGVRVRTAAIWCVRACKTAPERLTCLQGCLTVAEADGAVCVDNFVACLDACVPSTP